MKRISLLSICLLLATVSFPFQHLCAAEFDSSQVSGTNALRIVEEFLEISPRDSGTPNAAKAAEFIAGKLKAAGLKPETDIFTNATPSGDLVFRNVTATIEGKGNGLIVIGSHYDTKSGIKNFKGANDSGSSTGLLLELAGLFAKSGNAGPDIMLAFMDGEECIKAYGRNDGLHGSRRLAEKLKADKKTDVEAVVILDMIGDSDLKVEIPQNGSSKLMSKVFKAAKAEGKRSFFSLGRVNVLDDHVPFLAAGMPAIDLIDFEFGSKPGSNDYWHTDEDTIDKLSADSLETVGRVTVRLVNRLAKEKDR